MAQAWCTSCGEFTDLKRGKCCVCGRVPKGYEPVPTGRSSTDERSIDHIDTLNISDLTRIYGIGKASARIMANNGWIPAMKHNKVWVFDKRILRKWNKLGRPREDASPELYRQARSLY